MNIIKPLNDNREYKKITLDNKLDILLISDPKSIMSSVALNINIGYFADPKEVPGVAHLLEHVLLRETKKYPYSDYYRETVNKYSGFSNACTSEENTVYFFGIVNKDIRNFKKVIDVFSQFFIDPLFADSTIKNEIEAVNSEHNKNLKTYSYYKREVLVKEAEPSNQFSKFGIGNKETLSVKNIKDHLINFYKSHYSANNMKLVVISKESVNDLERIIVPHFSKIKNNNVVTPLYSDFPYSKSKMIEIKTEHDINILEIHWQIPNNIDDDAIHYLIHLMGHESKGSIYSILKDKGWVDSLTVGTCTEFLFNVRIDLTDTGYLNKEKIIQTVYSYIDIIKKSNHEKVYNELVNISRMGFNFKNISNDVQYIMELSENMHKYEYKDIISGTDLMKPYSKVEPSLKFIISFLTPEFSVISISSNKINIDKNSKYEKYYNTRYNTYPLESITDSNFSLDMHLPRENKYLPTDFGLVKKVCIQQYPVQIKISDNLEFWYKLDIRKNQPKVYSFIKILTPFLSKSVESYILAELFCNYVVKKCNEFTYDASLVKSKFNMVIDRDGIELFINGYHHKFGLLFENIIDIFYNYDIDENYFNLAKDRVKKEYENKKHDGPIKHAMSILNKKLLVNYYSTSDRKKVIDKINYKDIIDIRKKLFETSKIKSLIQGNILKDDSVSLIKKVVEHHNKYYKNSDCDFKNIYQIKKLNTGSHILEKGICNDTEINSGLLSYFQIGSRNNIRNFIESMCMLNMTSSALMQPLHFQLRVKEQLGYLLGLEVSKIGISSNKMYGISIFIQSIHKDPVYLDDRVESFINDFDKQMHFLQDFHLHNIINGAIQNLNQMDKTLDSSFENNVSEIKNEDYLFNRVELMKNAYKKITRTKMIAFYKQIFMYQRKQLSIAVYGKNHKKSRNSHKKSV